MYSESRFKNRASGVRKEFSSVFERSFEPLGIDVDERSLSEWVVNPPGGVAYFVTNLKSGLSGLRVLPQVRTVDLQPEALGTLPEGDDFGFGELAHERRISPQADRVELGNRGKELSPNNAFYATGRNSYQWQHERNAKFMRFTSLDFETANYSDASICAAGIAVFVNGELTETRHWLVRPPAGHDFFREDFIAIHGITPQAVQEAPEFPAVAEELLPFLTGADLVVAHNAQFDMRMLTGTLSHFGIPCPSFQTICTRETSRRAWPKLPSHSLDTVADHIGHTFRHHNALEDAEASGRVLSAIIKDRGEAWVFGHD